MHSKLMYVSHTLVIHTHHLIKPPFTHRYTEFFYQKWRDPRLKWNVSDYNGLDFIVLPVDRIWIPDVIASNR